MQMEKLLFSKRALFINYKEAKSSHDIKGLMTVLSQVLTGRLMRLKDGVSWAIGNWKAGAHWSNDV